MVGWTKGPKCDVPNCPSRLWTVIDGRNVCKNGHVSESALMVSDDEELRGYKRVKTATTQQSQAQEESKLAGISLLKAQAAAMAMVLREQNVILRKMFDVPLNVEHTCRVLFIRFANTTSLLPEVRSHRVLSMSDTICILWLSLALNQVPIYMVDLIRLIRAGKLPFRCPFAFASQNEELRAALEKAQFPFTNFALPENQTIWFDCLDLCKSLNIPFPRRPIAPLVYKLVRDLMLPVTLYPVAASLAEILVNRELKNPGMYMERSCLQGLAIALKALYRLDGTHILDAPDWEAWSDMMLKVWVYDDIVEEMDTKNIAFCDQYTIDRILATYYRESARLPAQLPQSTEQLLKIFPVPHMPDTEEYYDLDVHKELVMALYSDLEREGEPLGEIGIKYVSYSRDAACQWVAPPIMETLFKVCGRFLLMDADSFRQDLYSAESYISLTPCGAVYLRKEDSKADTKIFIP